MQGHQGRALAGPPARIGARGPQEGLPPPSEPAEAQALQAPGAAAARHQRRAGGAVRLPLGPGGGSRRREQRPDPDHAGPLYRAGLAQGPGERPEVQPEPAPEGRQWRPHPELRVPGHLPERPEPDLRAGARRQRQTASAAALGPQRDPAAGARPVPAVQPADRGHGAEARGRNHGRRHRLSGQGAGGEAGRLCQARRHASRPRRRLRRTQLPRARCAGAHLLQRGSRRRPARPCEVLLGRRLRPPLLHLGPQPRQELRRLRRGRRGGVPGRGSRDRLPGDGLLSGRPASPTPSSGTAISTALRSATRARWATPSASRATTSTATRPGSRATRSRLPVIPASRRQLGDRPQLHLLEQPRPLHRPSGRGPPGGCADRHRDHLRRA